MRYYGRLNKLEKKSQGSDGSPMVIKVDIALDSDKFERKYSFYQAQVKLGLVKFEEPKMIFACCEDMEDKYKNLTIDHAKKIIEEYQDEAD